MSTVLFASIAGLIAMVFWGAGDWLTARSSKNLHDKYLINFAVQLPSITFVTLVLVFFNYNLPDFRQFALLFFGTLFVALGYIVFVKALRNGALGIISPIGDSYPLVTLLLSLIFLGALFTISQTAAMLAIIFGVILLGYQKNHKKIPARTLHTDSLLAVTAALLWGAGFFVVGFVIDEMHWLDVLFTTECFYFLIGLSLLAAKNPRKLSANIVKASRIRPAVFAGFVFLLGNIAFYIGSDKAGSLLIPTVITGGQPLVASFLGAVVDKEKLDLVKRTGAVILVGGIILLNIV